MAVWFFMWFAICMGPQQVSTVYTFTSGESDDPVFYSSAYHNNPQQMWNFEMHVPDIRENHRYLYYDHFLTTKCSCHAIWQPSFVANNF